MRRSQPSLQRPCPNCGSEVVASLHRYVGARLVRCRRCRFVFTRELPPPAELAKHYAHYPAVGHLSDLTARRYRVLLSQLERFRDTGRLLDVGCGDGHFLKMAETHGWAVYGSEYGDAPRRRAQAMGLDVRSAPFPATADEVGTFDVVTAIEVLEHVVAPLAEVEHVRVLLRPGGCFYLTTPNFSSVTRRVAGAGWRAIGYPEHLNLFSPRTLDLLLTTAGLTKLLVTTTGISPSDLWAGIYHTNASARRPGGRPSFDQQLRSRAESSRFVDAGLSTVNVVLGRFGAGDTIKAFYVRP